MERKSHATRYGNHLDELWDKHWGPQSVAMKNATPTHAHKAIASFQKRHESIVATQNIDDLHERAGSDNVAHVHGVMNPICMRCKLSMVADWNGSGAPRCINCNSRRIRPNVVLFGENLNAKLMRGLNKFASEATYVVAVGTSLNVFPVAGLIMDHVDKAIIINKDATPFDSWVPAVYHEDADKVIDDILAEIELDKAGKV